MIEHAIESIGILSYILEQKDRFLKTWLVGGAQKGAEERQATNQQATVTSTGSPN